jgi:hypothetical protein
MKKLYFGLFAAATVILLPLLQPFLGSARALSGSQFQAGRIVDDGIFFNSSSMNQAQIQAFLNAKVPVCDTNHAAGGGFSPPFTCLKDFRQDTPAVSPSPGLCNGFGAGNKPSAQIIYEVAQSCGVNPQVLIVLLQKEQGLVTDTWPWPTQYRSATGYGCPDGADCDATYYGFFNQVYAAAKQFKRYVRDASQFNYRAGFTNNIPFNPNAACGGGNVAIENYATAALYNYTPYQPNQAALNNLYGTGDGCSAYGNRNFWRYFNDWFGTTFGTVLLKGSGPTVYVRGSDPNVAYAVASGNVLAAYGLSGMVVTSVSDSYLALLDTSKLLTTLFMKPLDNTIYLADGGSAYGIASGDYCTKWGLSCNTPNMVASLPYAVTNPMPTKPPIGNLMQFDNRVFVMDAGTKKPFINSDELSASPWANQAITVITSPLNSNQPGGTPLFYGGDFLKIFATNAIYYYSGGQYYGFTSFDNFKDWWDGSPVYLDKYSTLNTTAPTVTTLPDFASDSNGAYLMSGSVKFQLPSAPSATPLNVGSIPQLAALWGSKILQVIDQGKALRLPSGTILGFQGGVLHPIPTLADLSLLFQNNVLNVPVSILDGYAGGKLLIPSGRVVKPVGGTAIYLYGADNNLWVFSNLTEVNAGLAWFNNVLVAGSQDIGSTTTKSYTSTIRMGSSYYAVQSGGIAWLLPATLLSAQKDSLAMPITSPMMERIPTTSREVKFAHFTNGLIGYVQGNEIRPISSFDTYRNLGGNPNDTVEMASSALPIFNIGPSL